MIDEPEAAYHDALRLISESYADGIRAFATWMATKWTQDDRWWRENPPDEPTKAAQQAYARGFNAGIESAVAAAEFFLGDFHP